MRIFIITFATIVLTFVGSIVWSLTQHAVKTQQGASTPSSLSTQESDDMDRIEFYRKQYEQEREKNKVLTDVIVDLAKQEKEVIAPQQTPEKVEKTPTPSPVKPTSQTGSTKSPVALSGKFLSLIMPTVNLKIQSTNRGIYSFTGFENIPYSTYFDSKLGMKAVAIDLSYDAILDQMQSTTKGKYQVNPTDTFPFRSFYLNSIKPDTLVRLVLESEKQTIAIEIPKTKFQTIRGLFLEKEKK